MVLNCVFVFVFNTKRFCDILNCAFPGGINPFLSIPVSTNFPIPELKKKTLDSTIEGLIITL